MQIREVSLHRILVPLEEPTIWIGGADAAWSRTVLRMRTDEGFEGIAETSGDDATYAAAARTETAVHRKVTVRPSAHFGDPVGAAGGVRDKRQTRRTGAGDRLLGHRREGSRSAAAPAARWQASLHCPDDRLRPTSRRRRVRAATWSPTRRSRGVCGPSCRAVRIRDHQGQRRRIFPPRGGGGDACGTRCLPQPRPALRSERALVGRDGHSDRPRVRGTVARVVRGSGLGNRGHATHSPRRPHPARDEHVLPAA